ncbi:hypothetical protein [Rhizobium sp. 007]|uniref:hypothetical protein n=1 Tax=Rhizobium sp. 007 TaxID=2785056 RepID=UPI00189083AD|nr:hypothetical protein [Rhizobium sp. 007]QPB24228.1 hypothetical protein ISN39_32085 [Rhizobium sp. 007]
MAHNDPFTFDLFSNTGRLAGFDLTSGFDTPAPSADVDRPVDDRPAPPRLAVQKMVAGEATEETGPKNFRLSGDRGLAKSWKDRATGNISAIRLATEIIDEKRPATPEEQAQLIRFIASAPPTSPTVSFAGRARRVSPRVGTSSAVTSRPPSLGRTTPPLRAARNTPISRRSSSSAPSGPVCCAWALRAGASSNPASGPACIRH